MKVIGWPYNTLNLVCCSRISIEIRLQAGWQVHSLAGAMIYWPILEPTILFKISCFSYVLARGWYIHVCDIGYLQIISLWYVFSERNRVIASSILKVIAGSEGSGNRAASESENWRFGETLTRAFIQEDHSPHMSLQDMKIGNFLEFVFDEVPDVCFNVQMRKLWICLAHIYLYVSSSVLIWNASFFLKQLLTHLDNSKQWCNTACFVGCWAYKCITKITNLNSHFSSIHLQVDRLINFKLCFSVLRSSVYVCRGRITYICATVWTWEHKVHFSKTSGELNDLFKLKITYDKHVFKENNYRFTGKYLCVHKCACI
jgi:hypothetical protein